MINHVNKNIDIKVLEERLSEEIEEKLEFGCYLVNICTCDGACGEYTCSYNVKIPTCYANGHC